MAVNKQTYAISVCRPKTAALIYDKVWSCCGELNIPSDISFNAFDEYIEQTKNISLSMLHDDYDFKDNKSWEPIKDERIIGAKYAKMLIHYSKNQRKLGPEPIKNDLDRIDNLLGWMWDGVMLVKSQVLFCHYLNKIYGINSILIYDEDTDCERIFSKGDYNLIVSTLNNLNIVDETKLEWQQVSEFRKDSGAKESYIRFINWLNNDLIGKDKSQIEDIISKRVEDYEWALRKHGLKTFSGCLKQLYSHESIISSAVAGLTVGAAIDTLMGVLTGVFVMVGKTSLTLLDSYIDYQDIYYTKGREVAYINNIKKLKI